MEGRSLHPTRNRRGVHWFDPQEVEDVLQQRAAGVDVGARSSPQFADGEAHLEDLRRLAMDAIDLLEDRELRALPKPIVMLLDAIVE
jgi:hypothetical protein